MKPTYEVRVWQEDGWWLARVIGSSDGADSAPLNALTQARSLTKIESMARDLVATILDAEEGAFDIEIDYVLPPEIGKLLSEVRGARSWLDAAQELWQERSAAAARELADHGYSLRESAVLLGLSHQRVDQLLGGNEEREPTGSWAFQVKSSPTVDTFWRQTSLGPVGDIDVLLVVRKVSGHSEPTAHFTEMDPQLREQAREFLTTCAAYVMGDAPAAPELQEHGSGA